AAAPIAAQTTASESDLYSLLPIDLPPSVTLPVETDAIGTGGCPTVTEVAERCATCPTPHCLSVMTLTQSCGCPTPAPTEYLTLSCREVCARIGCSTSYTVVPGEASCEGSGSGSETDATTATATVTEVVPTVSATESTTLAASVTESGSSTGSESGTGTGSGASASASASPTPNAARRLGVPFKFW
ncbi:hypothetical protein CTA2_1911, partial [Colletotrichum tanaceti]